MVDSGGVRRAVEIKSGRTVTSEYFKGIRYWNSLTGSTGGTVIYGGTERLCTFASLRETTPIVDNR